MSTTKSADPTALKTLIRPSEVSGTMARLPWATPASMLTLDALGAVVPLGNATRYVGLSPWLIPVRLITTAIAPEGTICRAGPRTPVICIPMNCLAPRVEPEHSVAEFERLSQIRKGAIAVYFPAARTITWRVATAEGPPSRLTVRPVKTKLLLVEVPPLLVSVTVAVYPPAPAYVCMVVGVLVVTCWPSPKSQAYDAIVP